MKKVSIVLICLFNLFCLAKAGGQTKTEAKITDSLHLSVVHLKDGNRLIGKITKIEDNNITIVSNIGTSTIDRNLIKEISETTISSIHNGQFWFENPNKTRMVFAPTGYMLKQGEGYFQSLELLLISANVGVTDNFSIGLTGLIPITPELANIIILTPKIGGEINKELHIAAGGFLGFAYGQTFGLGYGVVTIGKADANFTLGAGAIYGSGQISGAPVMVVGGSIRLSRGFGLVTENYISISANATAVVTGGIRFFGERMTFDLGIFGLPGQNTGILGIPYASFVVKF